MKHIAIMRKSWGLTEKILSGEKKIESRWYAMRCAPWDRIKAGDTVYFKNSGEPITLKSTVKKVLQFADLTPARVKEILRIYGKADGLERRSLSSFYERFKNKKYCLLVFLENSRSVKPFDIDKSGFGAMSAWITVRNVSRITKVRAEPTRRTSSL
ncbi:hypothetical protein HYV30_01350 [Candidatus Kaiserbacteria bacterium]|nr:hypothetical protein [Candidatus Kaiserbacteria bacterium]